MPNASHVMSQYRVNVNGHTQRFFSTLEDAQAYLNSLKPGDYWNQFDNERTIRDGDSGRIYRGQEELGQRTIVFDERTGTCQRCGGSIHYEWDPMAWQHFWVHDDSWQGSLGPAGLGGCPMRHPEPVRMKPFPGTATALSTGTRITWTRPNGSRGWWVGRGISGLAYETVAWIALRDGTKEFWIHSPRWKKSRRYEITESEAISYLLNRAGANHRFAAERLLAARAESADAKKEASCGAQ